MKKIITMMSDWTYAEGAIGACKGVIKSIDSHLEIIDLTHEIPAYDIYAASYRLKQVLPFWPSETVHMVVVDPGVGTHRVPVVAKTKQGHIIVTPDNGTLTHIEKVLGLSEVRAIHPHLRLSSPEHTNVFHGRDIFAYVSAKLASGQITFEEVGDNHIPTLFELEEPNIIDLVLYGNIEIVDPNFGNAWTNIPLKWLKELNIEVNDELSVVIEHRQDKIQFDCVFAPTFGFVSPNTCVAYHNELDNLAFALNQASFIKQFNVSYGPQWKVSIRRKL
ncbi:MAG: SAM-dependent chlorinase/fluorinase [Erysipelotrichia bacterium]|jgi:S-adenosylmethionine hydrolase|nr:SAM-dependent chlorinase/fluorinase [Erysipelotrichia bacterium]